MYQPSADFVAQMDTRPFRVLLTGAGETVSVADLEFSAAWCPSAFSLGNANAASFTARYTGQGLPFGAGERVELRAALSLAQGGEEQVPLGTFTLTGVEREADSDQWNLTGEDALSTLLEEEFCCPDPANPPATAPQVLTQLCAGAGLTLAGVELVPDTPMALEYDTAGGSGTTMRELVGQIALLAGANARIDRQGTLVLSRLEETDCRVGPQRYYESALTLEAAEFCFGALEVTVSSVEEGDQGAQESEQVFTAQLEGVTRGLSFSSQWFDQTAFDGVWQAWQGKRWRPGRIEFLGDLRLDPGDVITVTDRGGTEYALAVMSLKHSFDGGFRTTVSCYGPAETGSVQPQTVSQAITGLKTDLGRFRRLYADNLFATNAQLKHITTEDIVGEHGTLNLAKGTFQFGDALTWDGQQMTVRGKLESEEGTIGGWKITPDGLEAETQLETGGTVTLRLQSRDSGDQWVNPKIGFYTSSGTYADVDLNLYRDEIECVTFRVADPRSNALSVIRMYAGRMELDSGGTLLIDGEPLGDQVTEKGVSNGWVWRKWASGIAECGKVYSNSQMSTFGDYRYIHEPFPFAFNAPPVVVGSDFENQRIDQMAPIQVSVRAVDATSFQAVLNTTQTSGGAVSLYVIGTYDNYDPT